MKLGEPQPVRKKLIDDLKQEQTTKTYPVEFQGQLQWPGVHRVNIEFAKYRLENGRTISAQKEYLAKHPDLPEDFFRRDAESDEAQEAQHKILADMIKRATPNLVAYFRDEVQNEPLILDSLGFVVNGNRRLCAMRILHEEDPNKYHRFSSIDVIVLPPVARKDVYALEVGLQLEPDVTDKYTWTDKASMIRRGRYELGFSDEALMKMYRMSKKELNNLLQALDLAEAYLEDRGVAREYHRVADAELSFDKLREGRNKANTEAEGDLFEKIAYTLIDDPDSGQGRNYSAVQNVQKYLPSITEQLKEELSVNGEGIESGESGEESDPFDGLLPPEDSGGFAYVAVAINKPEYREIVRETAIAVIDNESAKEKFKQNTKAAFTLTKKAHTSLRNALNALDDQSDLIGLGTQLDEIEQTIVQLRGRLSDYAQS